MEVVFCRKPEVFFVGSSTVNTLEVDRFVSRIGAPMWAIEADQREQCTGIDRLPEVAGRLCYMSFSSMLEDKGRANNASYLKHILEVGHESVLEHSSISFIITGVSRTLTHELVRHRIGMSYSQLSQRYVDPSTTISCVIPPDFLDTALEEPWKTRITEEYNQYAMLHDYVKAKASIGVEGLSKTELRKRILQATRSLLPNATETKIFVTFNLRSLRHFFLLRGNRNADLEIRRLAICLYKTVQQYHKSNALQDVVLFNDDDGLMSLGFAAGGPK